MYGSIPEFIRQENISDGFALNKLVDRGSYSAKSIVTNIQDFIENVSKGVRHAKVKE